MPLLEISLLNVTANHLEIKVKNISGASLDEVLVIEIYPPMYLTSDELGEASREASLSMDPPGAKNLEGLVPGPEGWSVWARRETSDSTLPVVLINGVNVSAEKLTPVKFAAGAEFTIRIPLDPGANRDNVKFVYNYKHGTDSKVLPTPGSLELKSETPGWDGPDVTLTTDHRTPTAIDPKDPVKIMWTIKDGVSATLRGPLPGGNTELTLSPDSKADFKIAEGALDIHVVAPMTYLLQAEVKRPDGKPNVQVVRMLSLDRLKGKSLYIEPRPSKVLPHGLIEIDWTAWGVKSVEISVSSHTTRNINLTRQTLGRFFEGTGVMRVSSSTAGDSETILIKENPGGTTKTRHVTVIRWDHMLKPDISGKPLGLAVASSKIALLTSEGLYIAEVGTADPQDRQEKLMFVNRTSGTDAEWGALTAVDKRLFVCLRRSNPNSNPDFELAPYSVNGEPDEIPPVTLPPDVRNLALSTRRSFDLVGFGKRAYLVVEVNERGGIMRRAYSVGFDSATKKADLRAEPMLEWMVGSRLVTFDNALYALNRESGRMFRFELTKDGKLDRPKQAASAVKEFEDGKQESMVQKGLLVPVGRVLVVLSPTSYPTVASLEKYGLHNVLGYHVGKAPVDDPNRIPQDLIYNPQKNYWARCGHDLNVKDGAFAAFREGTSPRLWVVHPDGETYTLAVGSESLFSHDYRSDFPTKPLLPFTLKKRKFLIKCEPVWVRTMHDIYRRLGFRDYTIADPIDELPIPFGSLALGQFDVDLTYNEANPAPVILHLQVARLSTQRNDIDYMLEVIFSGPDLSTATSCYRRISHNPAKLINDEVFGTRLTHSTYSMIEVPKPKRFDEKFKLVIVNASKMFRIKTTDLRAPNFILNQETIEIDHNVPDFSLGFDGQMQTQGVIRVELNAALPHGIEVGPGSKAQTRYVRLNTDLQQRIQIALVKVLMAGDAPLQLPGTAPILPMPDRPVCVCQLDYKFM